MRARENGVSRRDTFASFAGALYQGRLLRRTKDTITLAHTPSCTNQLAASSQPVGNEPSHIRTRVCRKRIRRLQTSGKRGGGGEGGACLQDTVHRVQSQGSGPRQGFGDRPVVSLGEQRPREEREREKDATVTRISSSLIARGSGCTVWLFVPP